MAIKKIFRKGYMAFGYKNPTIGECYNLKIVDNHLTNSLQMVELKTSKVEYIKKIYSNIYLIKDKYCCYITKMESSSKNNPKFVLIGEKPRFLSRIYFYDINSKSPGNYIVGTSDKVIFILKYKGFYIVKTMKDTFFCLLI